MRPGYINPQQKSLLKTLSDKRNGQKEEKKRKINQLITPERNDKIMLTKVCLRKMKKFAKAMLFLAVIVMIGSCGQKQEEETLESSITEVQAEEMTVWYTDPKIAAYMNQAASIYQKKTGIRIKLEECSSIDYLESINQANIAENQAAVDLYILNSDSLEKAYRAGLVTETSSTYEEMAAYPESAVSACIWQGKSLGYPFYYETSFFLYNKNFIENCPADFQEILDFSTQYGLDGTIFEGIETILKWDVQNLYYNYGFAGAYLNLGGTYGDDVAILDLTSTSVVDALSFYKHLNQSLYFDAAESDYNTVLEEFLNGKILYTIGGTQSLSQLEEAAEGGMQYGIAPLLDMNESLESKAIATNYLVQINPYGVGGQTAEDFAIFLTDTYIENFYPLTGKMSCKPMGNYKNSELVNVEKAYANSVQLPKLMKTTDYWMELELAFRAIWNSEIEHQAGEGTEEEDRENQAKMEEEIREIVLEQMEKLEQQMELQLQDGVG